MKIKLGQIDEFDSTRYLLLGDNTFAHFENDWPQIWGKYNWKTYRIAEIYYEDDVHLGGKEFVFVLLGLGFRVRHNDPDNDTMNDIKEQVKSIKKADTHGE